MPRSTPIAILLALMALLCLPAQPSAAQVIPKPNATREQLRTLIFKLNTQVADLKAKVKALTPPVPTPVQLAPVVLTDPVIDNGPSPTIAWIRPEQVADKTTGDVRWPDLLAVLTNLPASTQWCIIDMETGWMQTPEMLVSRDADAGRVMDFCHAVRPSIRFGRYGWPVTTCDAADDAVWHAADANLPGWNSVDFLSPSVYQATIAGDPGCVAKSATHAMERAGGKPVVLVASNRVYTVGPERAKLIPPANQSAHLAGGLGATFLQGGVVDHVDGVAFWRSDWDYRFEIIASGEIPPGVAFSDWVAYTDAATITTLSNAIKGESKPQPIPPTGANTTPPPVITPSPPAQDMTNCDVGTGAFGGYNVLAGPARYIMGKTIANVVRAMSIEDNQTVDLMTVENFTSDSTNYGGWGNPKKLVVKNWTATTHGGGDDYGYRGVVGEIEADGWVITTNGANKAALRLTGTTAGHIKGLKAKGGPVWLGGGSADGSNPQGFSNVSIEIVQEFAAANGNPSAMQLFKGSNVTISGAWTLPPGKKLLTCWNGASCTISGTVNGVKITEVNKATLCDGVPGATNVTVQP